MPTIFRWQNCRFYFYSHEGNEPPHVHIDCAENAMKIWLDSLEISYCEGFTSKEEKRLLELVSEKRIEFLEKWHDHFRHD